MMTCGWAINLLQVTKGWDFVAACRVIFFAYAAIGAIKFLLAIALSKKVEVEDKKPAQPFAAQGEQERQPLLGDRATTPEQAPKKSLLSFLGDRQLLSLVVRLFILFGLDSFASGLASLYVMLRPRYIPHLCIPMRLIWSVRN